MAMHAIAITPLEYDSIKQAWYADDATAGGSLKALREWWDHTFELGPAFGYYPNAVKTWLIVKEHHLDDAKDQFRISITTEGKRHQLVQPLSCRNSSLCQAQSM